MAEYIEREALLKKINRMIDYCKKDRLVNGLTALFQASDAIIDCKAADVAPVRHGRWLPYKTPIETRQSGWICNHCSGVVNNVSSGDTYYCPNCGARMDLEAQHE